jgi:2-oxoglutarate dehydrogenase E2 component (dihydrolipoamide succinyltransferase)
VRPVSEAAAAPPARPPAAPSPDRERRERMSSIRQRIAQRLVAAQQGAAILTTFNEADLSAVMALRAKYKDAFQKKYGVSLGFMSFFVKAAVEALRAFPVVNAWIDDSDIVYHDFYDIGVAVSTEKGLMVPVLRDAGRLSFAEIEKGIAELAARARDGKIGVADLQGGTFTITNGGVFGSLLSTPILNPPQSAILGMHTIQKRPVAVEDQVVVRPMMYLALSYDHRLIDGRQAVSFLVRIKECVEGPERLMLEI